MVEAIPSLPPPQPSYTKYRLKPHDVAEATSFAADCDVDVTTAQLLLQRGVDTAAEAQTYLQATLAGMTKPDAMADRGAAADRIAYAVRHKERIVVFGDYDVDGTTSAVVLTEILEAVGADVHALVADRFEGGYGLSDVALARCLEHSPALLVTCDCGSSDHARIADARAQGVDVIVVDHHLVPEEPLPADAFLNPHRPDCGFPYKGLCSAGLALSIGAAVRQVLGAKIDLRPWLDLVALGTVADVAPLDGDNRRLVRAGLRRLAAADARPAVKVLRQLIKIPAESDITGSDIGFRFAPRLNAPGRLGQSALTLRFLRSQSYAEAVALGDQIEALNDKRKGLGRDIEDQAVQQAHMIYGLSPSTGIVVADASWHRGVVGIVAARLTERFGVPAVVIAFDGERGHGSARTIAGFDVHTALTKCRGELDGFGGHRAAAGVNLVRPKLEAFRAAFSDAAPGPFDIPPVEIDLELGELFPIPTRAALTSLGPFGEANPAPIFRAHVLLEGFRKVGNDESHAKLQLRIGPKPMKAFAPHLATRFEGISSATVVAELRPDHWQGGDALELFIRDVV